MKVRRLHKNLTLKRLGGPNIGRRHKVRDRGCAVCEAYRYYDAFGRFPSNFAELTDWEGYQRPAGENQWGDTFLMQQMPGHVPRIVIQEVAEILLARG